MLKLKLAVIAIFLSFAGFALSNSEKVSASAETDFVQEIAKYKTWTRINKEPIKVATGFTIDGKAGDEQVFIVDGQEITNFRTGALSG